MTLAYTSNGVENVIEINVEHLRELAAWLCDEECFHDLHRPSHGCKKDCVVCARFERERQRNDGFCNECRDFAGKMLARYEFGGLR